jgi:hypothetical protein
MYRLWAPENMPMGVHGSFFYYGTMEKLRLNKRGMLVERLKATP